MRLAILVVIAAVLGCGGSRHRPVPEIDRVVEGHLTNGLRYVVIPSETTAFAWGIAAGTLHEEDGASGVAGRVLRVLRASAGRRHVESRWGADFSLLVRESPRGLATSYVDALAQIRGWIDAELSDAAATSELRGRDEPPEISERARASGTRLARHPPWGTLADQRPLTLEDLRRYRARWYVPSRMTVALQGPWPAARVAAAIEQALGDLPARTSPPDPPLVDGPREVVVGRGDGTYATASFLFESPAPRSRRELHAAVVLDLFVRALAHRLREATAVRPDRTGSASVEVHRLTRRVVSLEAQLVTLLDRAVAAGLLARELERVRLYGFEPAELALARAPRPRLDQEHPSPLAEVCRATAAERAVRGYLPVECDAEDGEREALIATVTDAEIDALRAFLDPRRRAVAVVDHHEAPILERVQSAIEHALGGEIPR